MVREDIIIEYVRGRDVLDVGSVGQASPYRLWDILDEHARRLAGIDIQRGGRDHRIVHGNMETYRFDRSFDVVTACDILEHVENQGAFLRNIRGHLRCDGHLIITTPNAKWPTVLFKPNPTHTCWHDRYTLAYILRTCGFEVTFFRYYYGNKLHYGPLKRLLCWRQGMLAVCRAVTSRE